MPRVPDAGEVRAQPLLPDFSSRRRVVIVLLIALAGTVSPLASNIYLPALLTVERDLDTTEMMVNASVAIFVFGTGIFPLFWAVLAERFGRKPIYVSSLLIFVLTSVALSLAQNTAMLMVFRLLQSLGSSSALTIGAAVIAEIYPPARRGTAVGIYFIGPLIGPIIGPTIGGYMDEYVGWRWIFWLLTIFGGVLVVCFIFLFPETLPGKRLHIKHPDIPYMHPPLRNPFKSFLVLRQPSVALSTAYLAMIFGTLYLITTSLPRLLNQKYNMSSGSVGLTYLAYGFGNVVGSVGGGRLTDRVLQHYQSRLPENENPPPEVRLIAAYPGAVAMPLMIIGYGWTLDQQVAVAVPLVFLFFIGLSMQVSMAAVSTFLVDAFPHRAASAVSVANFARYILAGVCILLSEPLVNGMGVGPLMTLMAGLCSLSGFGILCVQLYGKKWASGEAALAARKKGNGEVV